MRTETTGDAFQMRRLGERDVDAILALCEGNRLFYQYHPPMATRESILADMTALPPGKGMEDKAYVGFFEGEKLVAVLDWISGYPAKETAWIGLFMVSAEKTKVSIAPMNRPTRTDGLVSVKFRVSGVRVCTMLT